MARLGLKKFPRHWQYPLMISMVLPSMLLLMPAILTWQNLPDGALFLDAWFKTLGQVVPAALMVLVVVAPAVRLFVTRVLLEPRSS